MFHLFNGYISTLCIKGNDLGLLWKDPRHVVKNLKRLFLDLFGLFLTKNKCVLISIPGVLFKYHLPLPPSPSFHQSPSHPSSHPKQNIKVETKQIQCHFSHFSMSSTVSISAVAPPFSFSIFLARALALTVVDRTAVATFSMTSWVGGWVLGG